MLKLYHGSKLIGLITNAGREDMGWMSGNIELTPEAEKYRDAFNFMTDEDRTSPWPGDEAVFDNWFIEYEDGIRRETIFPAIHYDGEVTWRTDDGV
jgi:hypothetical protein